MNIKPMIIMVTVILSGCASINENVRWVENDNTETGRLVIFRDTGSHSKALKMYVGPDAGYVVGLKQRQYAILRIPTGDQVVKVNSKGSKPHSLKINLSKDETKCVQGRANPAAWVSAAIPIFIAAIPSFTAAAVDCPGEDYFSSFMLVVDETKQ